MKGTHQLRAFHRHRILYSYGSPVGTTAVHSTILKITEYCLVAHAPCAMGRSGVYILYRIHRKIPPIKGALLPELSFIIDPPHTRFLVSFPLTVCLKTLKRTGQCGHDSQWPSPSGGPCQARARPDSRTRSSSNGWLGRILRERSLRRLGTGRKGFLKGHGNLDQLFVLLWLAPE